MALKEVKKPQELDQDSSQTRYGLNITNNQIVGVLIEHLPKSKAVQDLQKKHKPAADLLIQPTVVAKTLDALQRGVQPTAQAVIPNEEFRLLSVPQQAAAQAGLRTILEPAILTTNALATNASEAGSKVREGQMEEAREAAEKIKPAVVALTAQGFDGPKMAAEIVQDVAQEQAKEMSKRERETYLTNFAEILSSVGLSMAAEYIRGMAGTKTTVNEIQRNAETRAMHAQHIQRTTDMLRTLIDSIVFKGIDDASNKKEIKEYEARMELLDGFSKRLMVAKADDKSMKKFDELFSKTLSEELGRNKALADSAKKLDGKASIAELDTKLFSIVARTYDRSIKAVYGV